MGFPGNVDFTAIYSLAGNRLRLELSAITDRKTPISLVQHQYFNLGTGPDVLDHLYQINANAFTETDEDLIPTGTIIPVKRTQYDLKTPRGLRDGAGKPVKYDVNLVLDQGRDLGDPVATVKGPDGALTLQLWTDRPGLQFYNGVYTDIPVPGLGGKHYGNHSGFCLEDQAFPDAVHHSHFPSVWHTPDRPYSHWCEIEIG
jgi:aldose 1-epimerase